MVVAAVTAIERVGLELADRLLEDIDTDTGGFGQPRLGAVDIAAHQLLWTRYMTTGAPRFGEAVARSLRTICRSSPGTGTSGCRPVLHLETTLSAAAQLLELLTWVWRVERCPDMRRCAEAIADRVVAEMRAPDFVASAGDEAHAAVPADANGLVFVALIEAGSVFERRDYLALAREVFDATVATGTSRQDDVVDGDRGSPRRLGDDATMSWAALRLFEAFGKRRDLDLAETWVATWEPMAQSTDNGLATKSAADARMIGVLARLHAVTGAAHYATSAENLAEALSPAVARSGIAAATVVADAQTAAQLVSIRVSGDPRSVETREMMRVALDCGLPDRLVLGPGAGGTRGERPLARIGIGANCLAPIHDAARLRAMLAPGGLAAAFLGSDACESVDSRRTHGIP